MNDSIIQLGNIIYGKFKSGFAGNVVGVKGICFSLTTMDGGNREPLIIIEYDR